MLFFDNLITDNEVQQFKKILNTKPQFTNWETDQGVIDHRYTIEPTDPEDVVIKRIVGQNFSSPVHVTAMPQNQHRPHEIHIDDYKVDHPGLFRYTYIIALDTVPEFKSIVWKERCWDNNELQQYVARWGKTCQFRPPQSNISETEDLEHTIDSTHNRYLADYLTLDGIFTYRAGAGCLFDATQLHCSSNWRKYPQFTIRQLLQIHVLTADPIAL